MKEKILVRGGVTLSGEYRVQGNKNAALPLIAASLLTRGRIRLAGTPRIVDVENLVRIVEALGVGAEWNGSDLWIDCSRFEPAAPPGDLVEKLRGAILLLGVLAPDLDTLVCPPPGGCPIGRRSFEVHWTAFRAAGFEVLESVEEIRIRRLRKVDEPEIFLEEASVTATENALLLLSRIGKGLLWNPAREPHIFTLVDFLRLAGCEIDLHPLCFRIRSGVSARSRDLEFTVPADYIDAGTMAIAAACTGGEVTLQRIRREELLGIERPLERFGLRFDWRSGEGVAVFAPERRNPDRLAAGPWPLFPTDLVSLAIVLATQGTGLCLVHDWMYEARMFFVDKLVRMGARVVMCDPHRVLVEGPSPLRGTRLESPDIRAGMALVVAGLCARGETLIEHSEVIRRGYEDVVPRLRELGAQIQEGGRSRFEAD